MIKYPLIQKPSHKRSFSAIVLKPISWEPLLGSYSKYVSSKTQIECYVAELNIDTSILGAGPFRKGTDYLAYLPIPPDGLQLFSN